MIKSRKMKWTSMEEGRET